MITKEQVLNAQTTGKWSRVPGSLKDFEPNARHSLVISLMSCTALRMDRSLQTHQMRCRTIPSKAEAKSYFIAGDDALAMKTRDLPYNHGQKFVLKIQHDLGG